jgi:addiction module HigA family antidote
MSSTIAKVGMKPPHPGAFREEALELHGLNVSTGADVLGVRRATLSDLVNEKTSLSPEMALRIEKAFGVNNRHAFANAASVARMSAAICGGWCSYPHLAALMRATRCFTWRSDPR